MNKEIVMLIVGVGVAESTEIAPWLAKRLVRWSARRRYLDTRRAEIRAEELEALVDSRPGKLFKLITALLFTAGTGIVCSYRLALFVQYLWAIQGVMPKLRRTAAITITRTEANGREIAIQTSAAKAAFVREAIESGLLSSKETAEGLRSMAGCSSAPEG